MWLDKILYLCCWMVVQYFFYILLECLVFFLGENVMNDFCKGVDVEFIIYFGYQNVLESQKVKKVVEVFYLVVVKYDLMNDLMFGGIYCLWKCFIIELFGVCSGNCVFDIVGGIGDLIWQFLCLVGLIGEVVLVDINVSMFKVGCDKLFDKGVFGNVSFVQVDVEKLFFLDNYFDCVIIVFGLCNVIYKDEVICFMLCVFKFGGCLLVLEFFKLSSNLLFKVYDVYLFSLFLLMGKLVINDFESYCYLVELICMYFDQEILKVMMVEVGFDCVIYYNMIGGIVVLYCGIKF